MAVVYSIHAYNQISPFHEADLIQNYRLFKDFDDACDVIESDIQIRIQKYNNESAHHNEMFEKPDRKKHRQTLATLNYAHYYETEDEILFVICKHTIE